MRFYGKEPQLLINASPSSGLVARRPFSLSRRLLPFIDPVIPRRRRIGIWSGSAPHAIVVLRVRRANSGIGPESSRAARLEGGMGALAPHRRGTKRGGARAEHLRGTQDLSHHNAPWKQAGVPGRGTLPSRPGREKCRDNILQCFNYVTSNFSDDGSEVTRDASQYMAASMRA